MQQSSDFSETFPAVPSSPGFPSEQGSIGEFHPLTDPLHEQGEASDPLLQGWDLLKEDETDRWG